MKNLIGIPCAFIFLLVFSLNTQAENPFNQTQSLKEGDYIPNTIILKMKSSVRASCGLNSIDEPAISTAFGKLGVSSVQKMYPRVAVPSDEKNNSGKKYVDLSLVYKIRYAGNIKVEKAIRLIQLTGMTEYAEPDYVQHMSYTPNDPSIGSQNFLGKINAYNAWDIWKGDTNMVIGIVDSGTDWDHPDLVNSIKYNYDDPINGSDDDSDGFVDNFRGWDVSEHDNNPMVGNSNHGSHVSGCAAATTDNGTGVAGPSFKCKFLPVKSTHDASTTSIDNGYDGIVYAADHGCSVINCSWGRSGNFSQFEQDIINYAAVNHDIVVVAAAGNNSIEDDHLPASYEHIVSVAGTFNNDSKWGFSNYGFKVDVCAPSNNVYSTISNNTYQSLSGTSMASPIAAGCIAMIRSKFPSFNAQQAARQLRVTCDNIYGLAGNHNYIDKLGGGRVNLFKAVSDTISPGIEASNLSLTDGNDNVFLIHDTVRAGALFTNLLRASSNLKIVLSSPSTDIQILDSVFYIGVLGTLDTISNYNVPFSFRINPSAALNTKIKLKMTFSDGSYSDFYCFYIVVNVDFLNIAVNDVTTSVTSIGRIGYNTNGPGQGLGFTYMGSASILYEAGFMAGISVSNVSDVGRNVGAGADLDLQSVQNVQRVIPGISAFDAYGKFDDGIASTSAPLNILVQHRAYAWTSTPDRNYVIFHYTIRNTGSGTLNNFYAGIFCDWDISPDFNRNHCSTDLTRRMGYSYSDSAGYYAGVKLLTFDGFNHYAIDNDSSGQGGVDMSDASGFSTADKYTTLSTMRTNSGVAGHGIDVCDVTSTGPFTILPGDSIVVAFALLASQDIATLQAGADAAQVKYTGLIGIDDISTSHAFDVNRIFPNPAGKQTTIRFTLSENNRTELSIFNALGEKVKSVLSEKLNAGTYTIPVDLSRIENGTYFFRLTSGVYSKAVPVIVLHQ